MKKVFFFFLISYSVLAQPEAKDRTSKAIDKIEPPFWYEGMNHADLQIMFYGKNISQNEVSVSNDIIIKGIQKTENPNYIFVTIDTKNVPAQDLIFTFKTKLSTKLMEEYINKKTNKY